MKKQTGIWIDSKKAIIVTFDDQKEIIETVESAIENRIYHSKEGDKGSFSGSQHISNEKKFEEREKHQTEDYLKKIMRQIPKDGDLYIFGPSMIKIKLQKEIAHNKLNKINLTSVEACDQLSNNQIVAKVKEHFNLK